MKASTMERTVFLILAVIFFILAVFVIFKIFPNLLLQLQLALGIVKLSNAEKAILCSIYRCVEGCMSMKVQELSWKDKDECEFCTCQDFCTGEPYGLGGDLPDDAYVKTWFGFGAPELSRRICNPKYPVIFKTKDKEKIEKSHLQLGSQKISDVRCIIPTHTSGPDILSILGFIFGGGIWSGIQNAWTLITGGTISENWVIIDRDVIQSTGTKEDCVAAGTNIIATHDSLKELNLWKDKTVKIVTMFHEFGAVNSVFTLFLGEEKYAALGG
ncbi:MAG: hypothetical protein QW228_02220 [Candidatus Aenigmatarchaeota archaeon]